MLAGDAISAPDHPITERAIAFAAHLRLNGFLLGPTETEVPWTSSGARPATGKEYS
jgi:hypothetical protein